MDFVLVKYRGHLAAVTQVSQCCLPGPGDWLVTPVRLRVSVEVVSGDMELTSVISVMRLLMVCGDRGSEA